MHDGQVGVAQEIAAATNAVDHARAHDMRRVAVAVHVNLDWRVHGNHTEATDQLGVVADALRSGECSGRMRGAGCTFYEARGLVCTVMQNTARGHETKVENKVNGKLRKEGAVRHTHLMIIFEA